MGLSQPVGVSQFPVSDFAGDQTMPVLDEAEAMMRRRGRRLSGDNGRPVTPPIITPSTVSPRTAPPTDLHVTFHVGGGLVHCSVLGRTIFLWPSPSPPALLCVG